MVLRSDGPTVLRFHGPKVPYAPGSLDCGLRVLERPEGNLFRRAEAPEVQRTIEPENRKSRQNRSKNGADSIGTKLSLTVALKIVLLQKSLKLDSNFCLLVKTIVATAKATFLVPAKSSAVLTVGEGGRPNFCCLK